MQIRLFSTNISKDIRFTLQSKVIADDGSVHIQGKKMQERAAREEACGGARPPQGSSRLLLHHMWVLYTDKQHARVAFKRSQ